MRLDAPDSGKVFIRLLLQNNGSCLISFPMPTEREMSKLFLILIVNGTHYSHTILSIDATS